MRNIRLTFPEIDNLFKNNMNYGTTRIPGYGEVIARVYSYDYDFQTQIGTAHLIVYTPGGEVTVSFPFENIQGWTPYYGPIPPPFGHTGGLPGGMAGPGWGQGQAFPSPWGGQGSQGGWGPWGGGY